jgi:hypothetical protein
MSETKVFQHGEKSMYIEQNTGQISIHSSNGEIRVINPSQDEGLAILRQEFGEQFTQIMYNINSIIEGISKWRDKKTEQVLYIMVLCETKEHIKRNSEFDEIVEYYGESFTDWRPFKHETILELFREYENQVGFKIKCILSNHLNITMVR